jgi:outer membrane protein OmpA-like peptidoglycan-associated protein
MRSALFLGALCIALAAGCQLAPGRNTGQGAGSAGLKPGETLGEEMVVVLPKADGHVGGVVVRRGDQEIVLDKPYATARVRDTGVVEPAKVNASAVKKQFSAALSALPTRTTVFVLYFNIGKDELNEESLSKMEDVISEITRHPAAEITVTGHTDTEGSWRYNDKLSLARATKVRDELLRRGVSSEQIVSVAGRGERELLVQTAKDVAEARNRRVEIGVR